MCRRFLILRRITLNLSEAIGVTSDNEGARTSSSAQVRAAAKLLGAVCSNARDAVYSDSRASTGVDLTHRNLEGIIAGRRIPLTQLIVVDAVYQVNIEARRVCLLYLYDCKTAQEHCDKETAHQCPSRKNAIYHTHSVSICYLLILHNLEPALKLHAQDCFVKTYNSVK